MVLYKLGVVYCFQLNLNVKAKSGEKCKCYLNFLSKVSNQTRGGELNFLPM